MQPDFSKQIISSFAEIAKEKGIDRDLLLTILEDVFRTMIRKKYETDDAFSVILNADRGEIQILHVQEVVPPEELAAPVGEISLEDAQKIDPDIELYDELAQEVNILDFGRRAVNMARQQLAQRIREIEKDNIYEDYTDRVGEIILGDVYQVRHNKDILVNHNGVELLLPRNEQLYKDRYRKGDTIRAVVTGVHMKNGNPTDISPLRENTGLNIESWAQLSLNQQQFLREFILINKLNDYNAVFLDDNTPYSSLSSSLGFEIKEKFHTFGHAYRLLNKK